MRKLLSLAALSSYAAAVVFALFSFWIGFSVCLFLGCAFLLILSPPVYPESDTASPSVFLPSINSPAVLITDAHSSKEVRPFVWVNFLSRYFGKPAQRSLSSGQFPICKEVCITVISDASSGLNESNIANLIQHVKLGGIAILEGVPAKEWLRRNPLAGQSEEVELDLHCALSSSELTGSGIMSCHPLLCHTTLSQSVA